MWSGALRRASERVGERVGEGAGDSGGRAQLPHALAVRLRTDDKWRFGTEKQARLCPP